MLRFFLSMSLIASITKDPCARVFRIQPGKLPKKLFAPFISHLRGQHSNFNKLITMDRSPQRGGSFFPQSKFLPVLGSRWNFQDARPSTVGTSILAPRAASVNVMGILQYMLSPIRSKNGWTAHRRNDIQVSRRTALHSRISPAGETNAGTGLYACRDFDLQTLGNRFSSFSMTFRAIRRG